MPHFAGTPFLLPPPPPPPHTHCSRLSVLWAGSPRKQELELLGRGSVRVGAQAGRAPQGLRVVLEVTPPLENSFRSVGGSQP